MLYINLEGKREGIYYHYKVLTKDYDLDKGEHKLFTWQRITILLSFYYSFFSLIDFNIIKCLLILIAIPLIFPFIHDNAYYHERHKLDPKVYSAGFNEQSTTSVAKSDKLKLFYPRVRNILFVTGIAIFIFIIITTILN